MTQKKRFEAGIGLCAVVVALLLIAGACSKKASSPPAASYSTDLKELRDRFNNDKDKVRLLLILDRVVFGGASEVESKVLDQIKDDRVRVYSVWVPILVSDSESWVPKAMKRLPDERITHYWDGQDKLVEEYKPILPTKRVDSNEYALAWDVYLLFPPEAEWKDQPPAPSYWMHQLWGVDPKNKFDGEVLVQEVKKLLR